MIIQSKNSVIHFDNLNWIPMSRGTTFYDGFSYDYGTIYETQPNVRVCVDFLARNIAQLGLHVFRRKENDDRERLRDHPISKLIDRPLPPEFKVTHYKQISSIMSDLGIYLNAYLLKIRINGKITGLLRIPPFMVHVKGSLFPKEYVVYFPDQQRIFEPNDIIHIHGYNPKSSVHGLSPLETLRRILAEEHAAGQYREYFWRNSARINGIIERPADAAAWSDAARARFKQEFEELYSGTEASGKTAILEDGMQWKTVTFSAQESEYLAGRKLTREECARAFHIPPPLVGILDHATFSNIREQHKSLYSDTLGPWLAMIEQDFKLQLLPEFEDTDGIYFEFNIQEKLQGDFQEQAASLQTAVQRPWMTANEARARMNLPRIQGGDHLVMPLNLLPQKEKPGRMDPLLNPTSDSKSGLDQKSDNPGITVFLPEERIRQTEEWQKLLVKTFKRQQSAITSKVKMAPDINQLWDSQRWNSELVADFYKLSMVTTMVWAEDLAAKLEMDLTSEDFQDWVYKNSELFAEKLNQATMNDIQEALRSEDPLGSIKRIFEIAVAVRAVSLAASRVNFLSNHATWFTATKGGIRTKTWVLGPGKNHRHTHIAVAGETVGIRETFSNGLRYPGDYQGGAEEVANCGCYLEYRR